MAINNIVKILIFLLVFLSCKNKQIINSQNSENSFVVIYKENIRKSLIYYVVNGVEIDSLEINDYYNTAHLNKFKKFWFTSFNERCGTDCSRSKLVILTAVNHKLVQSLNIQSKKKETYYYQNNNESQNLKDSFVLEFKIELDSNSNGATVTKFINNKLESSFRLDFEKNKSIFYNEIRSINSTFVNTESKIETLIGQFYSIKLDSNYEYFYHREKWIEIDFNNSRIYD
jgi:hypothetical protein